MPADEQTIPDVATWTRRIVERVSGGERFAGFYGTTIPDGCLLTALLAGDGAFDAVQVTIRADDAGELHYPSLTPQIPAAFWYERAAHDLSGVVPDGHPRLDPLLLLVGGGEQRPRPGHHEVPTTVAAATPPGPVDVHGRGMFTIPLGPVRSGVFESVEFLIETPGEEIPHLNIRPHYKHRGIAKQFEGRDAVDGVLVAERVEGIASVAHALAFCHAVEAIADVTAPPRARLLRVVYAELERIANHLEVAMRLADAAGLAVATSRFSWHKESIMRLVSQMCGSRFGRNVVVPGGVAAEPILQPAAIAVRLRETHDRIRKDLILAMKTPSFIDRLRGTGILTPAKAASWAALGPVGRASGMTDDNRWRRPTDAYAELPMPSAPPVRHAGDVMARANVRWDEIEQSSALALAALHRLGNERDQSLSVPVRPASGLRFGIGWAEAPQGEVLYGLAMNDGRIVRCFARSASLHDLAIFHDVFGGDVYTDFAFIEASFGLSYAGVAM
jgi:Ni,Fe-hydrogenase III large subunit